MERKTKVALIVLLCIIVAAVILVVVYFDGDILKRNCAEGYILGELDGDLIESYIDEEAHFCHLIYNEDGRKVGEIWIYCYPSGIEPYKLYTIKGGADQMIRSDNVTVLLKGSQQFRERACALYSEEYGFRCTAFKEPER